MTGGSSSVICVQAVYHGRVQGVGFRWTAATIARALPVTGSVRNRADGTVELIAQGERAAVNRLLAEIAAAMRGHIERTDVEELVVRDDLAGFRILR